MVLEQIRAAVKENDIDSLLHLAGTVEKKDAAAALSEYTKYYEHELAVAQQIHNMLARIKIRRLKNKIPDTGNYTFRLE